MKMGGGGWRLRSRPGAVRAAHRPSVARKTSKPENRDGAASPIIGLVSGLLVSWAIVLWLYIEINLRPIHEAAIVLQ